MEPIDLFISYSHKDEALRDELDAHLAGLRRRGIIQTWYDRQIGVGTEWSSQIDDNLRNADIILLLISSYFLASDYCYDVELSLAMERHEAGQATVIPIILRPVDWSSSPFQKLQVLPHAAKAVTTWNNQHEAFANITQGIHLTTKELLTKRQECYEYRSDKCKTYRNAVRQCLSDEVITPSEQDILKELRQGLGLKQKEAQTIFKRECQDMQVSPQFPAQPFPLPITLPSLHDGTTPAKPFLPSSQPATPVVEPDAPAPLTQAPLETLDPVFVATCRSALCYVIGPMGKMLVDQVISREHPENPRALVEALTRHIPNVQKAEAFRNRLRSHL